MDSRLRGNDGGGGGGWTGVGLEAGWFRVLGREDFLGGLLFSDIA